MPDFVLEIVSPSTWRADLGAKREQYAALGIGEYWLHDPHGRHLSPALAGQRLVDGAYVPLPATQLPEGPSIHSDALGLDLRLDGERLRFFDPVEQEYLRDLLEERAGASTGRGQRGWKSERAAEASSMRRGWNARCDRPANRAASPGAERRAPGASLSLARTAVHLARTAGAFSHTPHRQCRFGAAARSFTMQHPLLLFG